MLLSSPLVGFLLWSSVAVIERLEGQHQYRSPLAHSLLLAGFVWLVWHELPWPNKPGACMHLIWLASPAMPCVLAVSCAQCLAVFGY